MIIKDDCFILKNSKDEILSQDTSEKPTYYFYSPEIIKQAGISLMVEIVYISTETYEDIKNNTIFDGEKHIKISELILTPASLTLEVKTGNDVFGSVSEYEYATLPVKFTDAYLKDESNLSYYGIDYDDEISNDSDAKYIEHFFQLNNWLKFAFRYYTKNKTVSNIYIMDDEGDNGWEEKFYRLSLLNALIKEFDIPNNKFNWDFDFKPYIKYQNHFYTFQISNQSLLMNIAKKVS